MFILTQSRQKRKCAFPLGGVYPQRRRRSGRFPVPKGSGRSNHITVRGLHKVTVHCYLSLIAMQARE